MISVVIPTYNRAGVIVRSVESVLNQTYRDIEVIVVDDCSTDDTRAVLETIKDERLRYYCLEKNSGACAARNKGIELSRGEYIAFQDSDDEFLPNKMELQLNTLLEKGADIVFCAFEKIFSDGVRQYIPENAAEGFLSQRELIYDSLVSTQTILGKAEVIRSVGFDVTMPRMQDYDFIIRASGQYSVYFLNRALVNVYEQPDSITATPRQYQKRLEITRKLLEKYDHLTEKYPEWEVRMLKIAAHCEVMLDMDAAATLRQISEKEKNFSNSVKLVLFKLGLLKLIFKRNDRKK